MVKHLVGVAAGAAVAAVALTPDEAAAATGTMQYGAVNNAGITPTALWCYAKDGSTLSSYNFEADSGYCYAGEGDTVYGGYGRTYAINMSGGIYGAKFTSPYEALAGNSTNGAGVAGSSVANVGVYAYSSNDIGVLARGGRASIQLLTNVGGEPPSRTDFHEAGEIIHNNDGNYWMCVVNGTPGTWRLVAGPQTTGALIPIEPTRVYDSRWPNRGRIFDAENRLIDLRRAGDLATGAPGDLVVPDGATAMQYTLTVTNTTGAGFLAATSAAASKYSASTINWAAEGVTQANSTMGKLTSPELRIWCDGAGGTDFIIDVLGYYR